MNTSPRLPWRAGWLGQLLRLHSPSAHLVDSCWCQRREVGVNEVPRPPWALGMLLPGAGYARCGRCRRPFWACWKFHDVWYEPSRAQFALCEPCWGRSTPEQRWQAHIWVASLSPAGWTDEEMDAVRRVIFGAAA